jgi:signal transduction histidine kinase
MLSRLTIRQKLSLLLMVPLAAVIVTSVPFAAERIGDARSASSTARIAKVARDVGALIQNLQQERLVALGYLGAPTLDPSALLARVETVNDDVARLRANPATSPVLAEAGRSLSELDAERSRIQTRLASAGEAYTAYRNVDNALLDALRLANPAGVDAAGLRQLGALDALMRANEEASSVGAVLVGTASNKAMNRALITDAQAAEQQYLRQFRTLVPPAQAQLVELVNQGQAAQRISQLILGLSQPAVEPQLIPVGEALAAAVSYAGLRRVAQDRVARDIASAADGRARNAEIAAGSVVAAASLIFIAVVAMGVTVSRSISVPLRRLTRAAGVVADLAGDELIRVADSDDPDPAPPKLAAVEVRSSDEVGELAAALNRVQATAALMLERQVTTRRNVATMFANIARRTQNLVGRQISLIDELERTARTPELLSRLYRLDHVATRLRRSADSLLVVSGTIDDNVGAVPTLLVDVVRSALAEIEGASAVQLGTIPDVTVSVSLVDDLRLILAELLENAASFSPPGTAVEVTATVGEACQIRVVDHGIGMTSERIAEENLRMIERERLDVAPTSVLGLFVAGRLARRYGLGIRLQSSAGRGVTATVTVPLRLLSSTAASPMRPARPSRAPGPDLSRALAIESGQPFPWFGPMRVAVGPGPTPALLPVGANGAQSAAGGSSGGSSGSGAADPVPPADLVWPEPAPMDPPAPQATLRWAAQTGVGGPEEGTAADRTAVETRGGLTRRVPGNRLGDTMPRIEESPTVPIGRDPEAERAALNDFLSGAARAAEASADPAAPSEPPSAERPE